MLNSLAKPEFEELSPDLRWKLAQRRERLELGLNVLSLLMLGLLSTPMVIPGLNRQMDISLHEGRDFKIFGVTVYSTRPALEALGILAPEALQPIMPDESIAGFTVTSGFGLREKPCAECSTDHRGVDLATPVGTPIYAPATKSSQVKVDCHTDRGGGGLVANIFSPDAPELRFQALHLDECYTGLHSGGSIIAKTGASGIGTGAHLDWRQRDRQTQTHQHPTKGYLQWALTGHPPKTLQQIEVTAIPLNEGLITCAIGKAEGTINDDCTPNHNYTGHVDPGNGVWNQGAFSYQHGASSPGEADAKQLAHLKAQIPRYQEQSLKKFGKPLSKGALVSVLDLHNQSPAAAQSFIEHLVWPDPSPDQIIDARTRSFIDPATGRLDAPGLGNTMPSVRADQKRRTDEVVDTLQGE